MPMLYEPGIKGGECPAKVRRLSLRDENHQPLRGVWGHSPPGKFGVFNLQRVLLRPSNRSLKLEAFFLFKHNK